MTLLTDFYINSTHKISFWRIFIKVAKCKLDIMPFIFLVNFFEKWISVRERNINLLLEAVTYVGTTETVTRIIAIETVMCIMHCRKYHLHDYNRDSYLHNFNKNCHPHICYRNFHWHKCCRSVSGAWPVIFQGREVFWK